MLTRLGPAYEEMTTGEGRSVVASLPASPWINLLLKKIKKLSVCRLRHLYVLYSCPVPPYRCRGDHGLHQREGFGTARPLLRFRSRLCVCVGGAFVAQYIVYVIVRGALSGPEAVVVSFNSCAHYRSRGHKSNENIKRLACFWSSLREELITTKGAKKRKSAKKSAKQMRR